MRSRCRLASNHLPCGAVDLEQRPLSAGSDDTERTTQTVILTIHGGLELMRRADAGGSHAAIIGGQ
jgi:hypothetical protein